MTALVRILSYVRVRGISKMTAYNREYLRNNVHLSLYTSAVTMHDLKKHRFSRWNFVAIMIASETYLLFRYFI